jgi:hypothetical protein
MPASLLAQNSHDGYVIWALSNDTDKNVASRNISVSEYDPVVINHSASRLIFPVIAT